MSTFMILGHARRLVEFKCFIRQDSPMHGILCLGKTTRFLVQACRLTYTLDFRTSLSGKKQL